MHLSKVLDWCVVKLAHFKELMEGQDHEELAKSKPTTTSFYCWDGRRMTCSPFLDTAAPVHYRPTRRRPLQSPPEARAIVARQPQLTRGHEAVFRIAAAGQERLNYLEQQDQQDQKLWMLKV